MPQIIKSEKEMIDLGKKIAADLHGGDVVLLYGDLGAGKTTLTKGIALGLGIESNVVSPTFTLMQVYNVRNTKATKLRNLVHIDTYRLEDEKQLLEIGAQDYIGDPETVCVIEWPEKVKSLLEGKNIIKTKIKHEDNNKRAVSLSFRPTRPVAGSGGIPFKNTIEPYKINLIKHLSHCIEKGSLDSAPHRRFARDDNE